MCGICGYVSKKLIKHDELRAMNDTMIHRGPDDNGVEIYEGKHGLNIGFAQRRLSIMDLSELGHQPMHSPDGRLSVVYNGEIYNYRELREEISDYPYKSTCDTEIIIAAFLKWGIDFVNHINGMYAIAIYDRETGKVYLIRDRIGKKPLCYWLDGENLVFGSELKPIMKFPGFNEKINKKVISRYLFHQYINAPETVFENVYKLEPGSYLEFENGKVSIFKYWDIADTYAEKSLDEVKSYEEAREVLKDKLLEAVRRRMIADVPVGTFLSGGYDSSLITAMACEVSDSKIKSFSIGFEDPKYNEAGFAKEVANHLGTEHTEEYIDEKSMFEMISDMPVYYDEPFADDSLIATMLVSKLAKKKVTVTLSGDGGDEFFCGYNVYGRLPVAKKLDGIGGILHGIDRSAVGQALNIHDRLSNKVRAIVNNRDMETKTQLGAEGYLIAAERFMGNRNFETALRNVKSGNMSSYRDASADIPCKYPFESRYKSDNWQIKRMLLDMDTYLPGDILLKVDHAAMKYSLESRCPIMDTDVMEYSFRIPHEYKYRNGEKKYILKDIAYDYIPKELLDRPKKGFSVPIDSWLRGPLLDKLKHYSSRDFLIKQDLFDADYVEKFVTDYVVKGDGGAGTGENYSGIVWAFMVFQQWYERYL